MDPKTVATAWKVLEKVVKYVYDDLNASYALTEPAWANFSGEGIGIGNCTVGPLTINSEKGGTTLRLEAQPFPASSKNWNGPNVIPDDLKDGSMEMSLWHDLVWKYAGEIAACLDMTEAEVMIWGNGILAAAWPGYAERLYPKKKAQSKIGRWIAYNLCQRSQWIWRHIRGIIPAIVSALVFASICAGCSGCETPPDWHLDDASPIVFDAGK